MSDQNNDLKITLSADVSGLKKGMDEGKKAVEDFGKQAESVGKVSTSTGKALDTVGDAARNVARDAAEAAGAGGQLAETVGNVAARSVSGAAGVAGLALAVGTALVVAFEQGRSEAEGYAKALTLTGNVIGATVSQLAEMAGSVAGVTGATQNATAQVVAQVVSTGAVMRENVELVAEAAVRMERAGVQSAEKTVKAFEELGKEPVKASEKLNEATNYLTADLYLQIKALEEQGKVLEAAALAQRAYAESSVDAAKTIAQNFGFLESLAKGVADAGKNMWDAILGVGRKASDVDRIAELTQKMAPGRGIFAGLNSDEKAELETLTKRVALQEKEAQAKGESARQEKAKIEWIKIGDQYQSKAEKRDAEILKVRTMGVAAGATELEIQKQIGAVREKYAEKEKKVAGPKFDYQAYAGDLAQVNSVRKQEQLFLRGHLDEMAAMYRMGLVLDEDYVRARTETALKDIAAEERRYQGLASVAKKYGRAGDATRAEEELKTLQVQRTQTAAAGERELLVLGVQRQRQLESWVLTERDALGAIDFERSLIGRTTEEVERLTFARKIDLQVRNATRLADGTLKVPTAVANAYESAGDALKRQRGQQAAQAEADRGDWLVGARRGLAEYERTATNVASQVERAFGNAAQGMEDSIVSFAMTGKINFGSLVNSILADLVRMQAKAALSPIFNSLASGLSSYFSGSTASSALSSGSSLSSGTNLSSMGGGQGMTYGGGLATGGAARAGMFYEVAEEGPELLTTGGRTYLMMGNSSGAVTPAGNGSMASGGQSVRVELINTGTQQEVTSAVPRFDGEGMVVQIFVRDLQRNGPMAQALTAFRSRR
jgi:lambda family phage tail tape measure protein